MRTLSALVLFAACSSSAPPPKPAPPAPPQKPIVQRSLADTGLDPGALDRTANPCSDFFQFACGGWLAKTEIPADRAMAMRSFIDISDRNSDYLHDVLEKLRTLPTDDPTGKQLGAYYGSCMDEAAVERAGLRPLAPLRAVIARVRDPKTLSAAIAALHAEDFGILFATEPAQDARDATQVIISIDQRGLGLPEREYYLKDDEAAAGHRAAYVDMAASLLQQLGSSPAAAKRNAARVLELETKIARVSLDKVKRRDPKATYNRLDKQGVREAMPRFDWDAYWKTLGLAAPTAVTVTSREFLAGLDPLLAEPPDLWRAYLTVHLAAQASPILPKRIRDARFQFTAKLTGQQQQAPRWQQCVQATSGALRDLLGQIYVRDRFAGESKAAAEAQVEAIRAAMARNLDGLAWMDPQTRARAHAKLRAIALQIGHPKAWRTYPFAIEPKAYAANTLAAYRHDRARRHATIGKPLDRDDWFAAPETVDAFYDAQRNVIVFPAGILQPPFYSVDAAIPVNLGGFGMVVGHEITHGFDDQGAQFDAVGNLANWWEPATEQQFKARTQCVIDQYGQYTIAGVPVNGQTTVGENIADIGGIKLAFAAYRALRDAAPEQVVADGFTEDQQFFLSVGQIWCTKARESVERLRANTDVHAPPRWRVNGSLAATPEFARAFGCQAPPKQCAVW